MKPYRRQTPVKIRPRRVLLLLVIALVVLGIGGHAWAEWEYRTAQAAIARRDFAQAQKCLERCSKVWFLGSKTQLLAARAARRAGNYDEAAKHLRECQALGGSDQDIDLEFKLLRAQQGDLKSVEQALWSLVQENHPESVSILEVLTPAYLQSFQLNSTEECISRWLEHEPDSLEAWQYRAQVYARLQIGSKLLTSYSRLVELDPANDDFRLQLAGQLAQAREPQKALEQYQYLRPRLGDTPQILCGMAGCLTALNQPDEARRLLEEVLAREPHNALALAERGRLAMEFESPSEAEKLLRQALAENPTEHDVLYNLFQCLLRQGKNTEAAEVQAKFKAVESDLVQLREAMLQVTVTPHDPEPRYKAGSILLKNGKIKEGLRWLGSALVEDPRHKATHRALADYYDQSGDSRRAAQHRKLAL
jgi:Tfp pilus assembly protein PilF